jgi:peptidylprolyl isomerase
MNKTLGILFVTAISTLGTSCHQSNSHDKAHTTKDTVTNSPSTTLSTSESSKEITTLSGLKYTVVRQGAGDTVMLGQEVLIHEKLWYTNDSLLFSSRNLDHPVKFLIGALQAIDGVDEGVRGMQIGEIRKLIVPPALSKRTGKQTFPHPDSTLVYEIELVEILDKK